MQALTKLCSSLSRMRVITFIREILKLTHFTFNRKYNSTEKLIYENTLNLGDRRPTFYSRNLHRNQDCRKSVNTILLRT